MIVVVGGIKGGTGKTTLATNLAVLNASLGRSTLLIDTDEQRSTSDWADQRASQETKVKFPTISLVGKNIHEQIMKFVDGYDDIYIDAGGRATMSQRSALTIADHYLIPFKPRSFDIWTIGHIKNIIDEIKVINPNLKVTVCINQGDARGTDNVDALKILCEIPEFHCLATFIGHRKAFSNAAAQGLGIFELDDVKAKDELLAVHRAIYH